ncbi:alkylated DNA repair dioxygenase AlkB [Prauserella rugosa]|uniref:Alkylated DNA repair dioxygenase AlkB n=2 Tax=Prauserella rugosa TaxID=43354 RepID=A0A660CC44_9PSEU|nr:alkylated DNA repair dioxygenase AlkB [Prauserella rugosa]
MCSMRVTLEHMNVALQGSLFDSAPASAPEPTTERTAGHDTGAEPALRPLDGLHRTHLGDGAWVDVLPGWLTGADLLFDTLATQVPWRAERRRMYDRTVDVPRLLCFYDKDRPLPHDVLAAARDRLSAHYGAELGERFRTAGLCYYRDGGDSVAWHGDTIGRGSAEDTMVAILSVGAARPLLLRPRGGGAGATVRYGLGHGDLIVMGGSCQRTWEHAVPKTSKPVGPRISIQFRPRGVR